MPRGEANIKKRFSVDFYPVDDSSPIICNANYSLLDAVLVPYRHRYHTEKRPALLLLTRNWRKVIGPIY